MASVFLPVITCHCSESRPARSNHWSCPLSNNLVRSSRVYLFKNTNARRTMTISCFHPIAVLCLSVYIYICIYKYLYLHINKYICIDILYYIYIYSIYIFSLRNKQWKQNEQHVVLMNLHLWPSHMVLVAPYPKYPETFQQRDLAKTFNPVEAVL